jgi:hypothetical protein
VRKQGPFRSSCFIFIYLYFLLTNRSRFIFIVKK